MRSLVEERLGGHDLTVLAEAAGGDLLVDPRLLQRMELAVVAQPLERGDLAAHRGGWGDTRADRRPVDDDRAGPALAEPAAEFRPLQGEIVAKDVQERRRRFDVDRMRRAVHFERDGAHAVGSRKPDYRL